MNSENLKKWALVAEIISGVAIVISLVFVGLQINQSTNETTQNTKALEANAYQDLISQISSMNMLIIQDPEFADIYSRMLNKESPKDAIERQRVISFITLNIRYGDMAYRQYQNGLIDEDSLDSILTPLIVFLLRMEPAEARWNQLKNALNSDYIQHVERLVELGMPISGNGT
jgi:hypothetical protein